MPYDPRQASMARCVSMESMMFFLVKSHSVSMIRMRGSSTDVTRSRVSSSDFPTLTTTSSQTSSTERIAGTIGKSSLTALRTMVKPESMSGPELQVVEAPVEAVGPQQVVVTAALDDAPLRQHHDEISVLHRGQAVGDDEHGAMLHEALDRLLHQALRFGVERTRRFVEDEERWIAQQGARDRDALALPPREARAPLAQHRLIAVGEAQDELVRIGGAGRRAYLLEREIGAAVRDVREHRVVQEHRLLRHDPHEPSQRAARVARDRHTVQRDLTPRRLVEAGQQVDERRL